MKYYFISFSLEGKNQGVIQTQAEDLESAMKKIKGIVPKHDHKLPFEMVDKEDIECDRLYTPEEMMKRGNERIKY